MKLFQILLSALLICTHAHAQTVVELSWPFSIASSTTNYFRAVVDQANKDQNEFQFILVQRTGAGGSIAANHVKSSKSPALLATSNAFFVRHYLFPNQSYEFREFRPLLAMSSMPMGFVGKANSSWSSITKKDKIFVGVPGIGSFSYVLAYHFSLKYPQTVIVPYQGTTEALRDVAAGVLDLCLDVPAMALSSPELYKMHYITGTETFDRFLLAQNAVDPIFGKLSLEFAIFAPGSMETALSEKLRIILTSAHATSPKIKNLYADDFVRVINKSPDAWYKDNISQWSRFVANIKVE